MSDADDLLAGEELSDARRAGARELSMDDSYPQVSGALQVIKGSLSSLWTRRETSFLETIFKAACVQPRVSGATEELMDPSAFFGALWLETSPKHSDTLAFGKGTCPSLRARPKILRLDSPESGVKNLGSNTRFVISGQCCGVCGLRGLEGLLTFSVDLSSRGVRPERFEMKQLGTCSNESV